MEEIDNESKNDGKGIMDFNDIMIVTAENKRKRKCLEEENSDKKRSKIMRVKQGEELYDDSNKIQVNEEKENDVKDFRNKIVEVYDEEMKNDDKDVGNKIVEADDTDMEESRGFAQGSNKKT